MKYQPNKNSLMKHKPPKWYLDAKLGIFIHWGLYSVPAFAPTKYGDIHDIISKYGFKFHFAHNPYAEWYQNSIRINEEPYKSYHKENYGEDFKYEQFVNIFDKETQKWNPEEWASFFKKIGARYVVITTKHHDGFLLWSSKNKNPKMNKPYHSKRNIVKELTQAVRNQGMKMGLYYSGQLDWSFSKDPIRETTSMIGNGPFSQEYADYADKHFYELINVFKPDILWNDIAFPKKGHMYEIIAHYYNTVRDGVINDRWNQIPPVARFLKKTFLIKKIINYFAKQLTMKEGVGGTPGEIIHDYTTPEYAPSYKLTDYKWESCRGIGRSFGYNKMETVEHYLSEEDLIQSFIDIVSKNGNLLLNIGPKADGSIPEIQKRRLIALGEWLEIYGSGIFETEPWNKAEGMTESGLQVRFTRKDNNLYLFILGIPEESEIVIMDLELNENAKISFMKNNEKISWKSQNGNIILDINKNLKEKNAVGFKIIL